MLAVITGASGLLGGNLAIELRKQGVAVRATKRGSSKVTHLDGHGIEWVQGDLDDVPSLQKAFEAADVVFHCAAQVSIRKDVTPQLVRANVDGTRNVLKALGNVGGPRLVHTSSVVAVGLSEDGRPCTEEARWNFLERGMGDGYSITKRDSEVLVQEAARQGVDVVTVNPCYMFGPFDAKPSSGKLIIDIVKGRAPGWTPGGNNFVDVRDVARGMILAWQKGKTGERYILGGQNMGYREIMRRIAEVAGSRVPAMRVPRPLANVFGWVGDLEERLLDREPLVNTVAIRYGFCTDFQFSSDKAKRELGYATGPIEPAIGDAIQWFRGRGML